MTTGEETVVSHCHKLLDMLRFNGVKTFIKFKKQIGKDWSEKLDQAEAICDVMIAADIRQRFPNGLMDYYGMIRVTRFGPVVFDDFKKLMKLLDGRENVFPFSQEAAQYALSAWSLLSKPHLKAKYDLIISGEQSSVPVVGGRGFGGFGGRVEGTLDLNIPASQSPVPDNETDVVGGRGRGRGRGGFGGQGGETCDLAISAFQSHVLERETDVAVRGLGHGRSENGRESGGFGGQSGECFDQVGGRGRGRGRNGLGRGGRGGRDGVGFGGEDRRTSDLPISASQSSIPHSETNVVIGGRGCGRGGGGGGVGIGGDDGRSVERCNNGNGEEKGKEKMMKEPLICPYCYKSDFFETEYEKKFCFRCNRITIGLHETTTNNQNLGRETVEMSKADGKKVMSTSSTMNKKHRT